MSKAPIAVQIGNDLAFAIERMQEHQIRHLPVLDGEQLAGIVSERDLAVVESLVPNEWESISVAEAMTPHPYTVSGDTPVREVARVMADNRYGCAIVVDEHGTVCGLFTTTDALRLLARD
jgi:acetoin utilization protein AcuB